MDDPILSLVTYLDKTNRKAGKFLEKIQRLR